MTLTISNLFYYCQSTQDYWDVVSQIEKHIWEGRKEEKKKRREKGEEGIKEEGREEGKKLGKHKPLK